MPQPSFQINVAGESGLIVYFNTGSLIEKNQHVSAFSAMLLDHPQGLITSVVPAYHSVLVNYDPLVCDQYRIRALIQQTVVLMSRQQRATAQQPKEMVLPVCYGLPEEHDLQRIANHNKLSVEQVVELHQQTVYRVYCLGFAPGFAFLGEVDAQIATPRLATPRKNVPAGAVAIADRQTAVYPQASPGGWNLIGLCPLRLFDPQAQPPVPFKVGDRVRFKAISASDYKQLQEQG